MSLYFPDQPQSIDLVQPRLHAFIVGVGDYPHLIGGTGHPAVSNFGLKRLTTTILTAKKIANWLLVNQSSLAVPLGSIELLLSPTQFVTRPDGVNLNIDAVG